MISKLRNFFGRGGFNSAVYWENRYRGGGTSGEGSYGHPALFKAEAINDFVAIRQVHSVIEFGCGDGNQLAQYELPCSYLGIDTSASAIELCRSRFSNDCRKKFVLPDEYQGESAELSLSVDVIFHLVEDEIYHEHLNMLFAASERYVGIYSSNTNDNSTNSAPHVLHRKFTDWISANCDGWVLTERVKTTLPSTGNYSIPDYPDFYFFETKD